MSTEHILVPKAKYEMLVQKYNSSLKPSATDKENQGEEIPKGVEPAKKSTERNDVPDQDHNSDFADALKMDMSSENKTHETQRSLEEIMSNHENFLPPGLPADLKEKKRLNLKKMDNVKPKPGKRRNKPYSVLARKWLSL